MYLRTLRAKLFYEIIIITIIYNMGNKRHFKDILYNNNKALLGER
jgi:hypothetical protein